MFPPIDVPTYKLRSILPGEYVDNVEVRTPGYTAQAIANIAAPIYDKLRKRYGTAPRAGAAIPFGQNPAPLTPAGTNPPPVTLTGTPRLGSYLFQIQILAGGALGTAAGQWSSNGGTTWTAFATAATVVLGATGVTAAFSAVGTYSTDNLYVAPTPVPETFLGWLVALLDMRILRRRGFDPNDPEAKGVIDAATAALAEIEKAANGQDGLYELPVADGQPSAVTTGGVLSYTEAGSPYVSADRQERDGRCEDERGFGTYGGA